MWSFVHRNTALPYRNIHIYIEHISFLIYILVILRLSNSLLSLLHVIISLLPKQIVKGSKTLTRSGIQEEKISSNIYIHCMHNSSFWSTVSFHFVSYLSPSPMTGYVSITFSHRPLPPMKQFNRYFPYVQIGYWPVVYTDSLVDNTPRVPFARYPHMYLDPFHRINQFANVGTFHFSGLTPALWSLASNNPTQDFVNHEVRLPSSTFLMGKKWY